MRFCGRGTILIGLAVAGLAPTFLAVPAAAAGQTATRLASPCIEVTATIPLAKASGGIAINPKTDTVYATNGGYQVIVISGQTNTVVATIPVGAIPDAVAVNPNTNIIYVANQFTSPGPNGTVSVLSAQTNMPLATITVGVGPAGVAADPETNIAYVSNAPTQGSPSSVSVLGPCPGERAS